MGRGGKRLMHTGQIQDDAIQGDLWFVVCAQRFKLQLTTMFKMVHWCMMWADRVRCARHRQPEVLLVVLPEQSTAVQPTMDVASSGLLL